MNENTKRAEVVARMLAKERRYEYEESPQTAIADVLADLRHLADLHGLDFAELDRKAYEYYRDEVDEHGVATHRKQDWTPRKYP